MITSPLLGLEVLVHAYNPSTWEVEAEDGRDQGHPPIYQVQTTSKERNKTLAIQVWY